MISLTPGLAATEREANRVDTACDIGKARKSRARQARALGLVPEGWILRIDKPKHNNEPSQCLGEIQVQPSPEEIRHHPRCYPQTDATVYSRRITDWKTATRKDVGNTITTELAKKRQNLTNTQAATAAPDAGDPGTAPSETQKRAATSSGSSSRVRPRGGSPTAPRPSTTLIRYATCPALWHAFWHAIWHSLWYAPDIANNI